MNWMTSGRHRALRSERGRRRLLRFPGCLPRQRGLQALGQPRVVAERPAGEREGDEEAPWYRRVIADDTESHDVFLLEFGLTRESWPNADVAVAPESTKHPTPTNSPDISRVRSDMPPQNEKRRVDPDGRCIFTPQKRAKQSARARLDAQPARKAARSIQFQGLAPSTRADSTLRLFNDGERMPDGGADCSMPKEPSSVFQRGASGHFNQGQPEQDFYMGGEENVSSTTVFDGREAQHFACSPNASIHIAVEPTDERADWDEIASTREAAKSSSDDSTFSQDSVLARPPIDWQKQLAFASATETAINLAPKSSAHKEIQHTPQHAPPLDDPRVMSSSSSINENTPNDPIDNQVPGDVRERLKSVITSRDQSIPHQHEDDTTEQRSQSRDHDKRIMSINTRWQISSRTRKVLDLVKTKARGASCKANFVSNDELPLPTNHLVEEQRIHMESIAIYMCVLVGCYRINERVSARQVKNREEHC